MLENKYLHQINNYNLTVIYEQLIKHIKRMSSIIKQSKKLKTKQSPQKDNNILTDELKRVLKSLNQFLKNSFDKSCNDLLEYTELVKQYFIEESTNSSYCCLVSSLFSKISNMLQPFLQNKDQKIDTTQQRINEQMSNLTSKIEKQQKKIKNLKQQLNNYRNISTKLTNFVYMLRVNNIDVDLLYQRGCQRQSQRSSTNINLDRQFQIYQESNTQDLRKNQIHKFQIR